LDWEDKTPVWYSEESEEMKISNYSSLVRVVDPRYPTNFAILVLSSLAGGAQFLFKIYQGTELLNRITAAIPLAVTVFLTWALGREIDPEHELAAFAGLALVIPGYWLLAAPDLMAVLTILLLLRLLNRITGVIPKFLDSLTISGLGIWLVFRGDWIFGFLTAAAFFLDSRLSDPKKQNLFFSGIMTIFTIVSLLIQKPAVTQTEIFPAEFFFVIGVILLFMPLIVHSRDTEVICDFSEKEINPLRVQASQIFTITSVTLVWLIQGRHGIINLMPIWSSIIALSIAYLLTALLKKIRQKN
jgi:hypothetical protein